jgi:hypothetical protein
MYKGFNFLEDIDKGMAEKKVFEHIWHSAALLKVFFLILIFLSY